MISIICLKKRDGII